MAREPERASGGYRYRRRSTEQWEKRATASGSDFEGIFIDTLPIYKVRDGENHIRILPPAPEWEDSPDFPGHYGLDIVVHNQVGPNKASVLCLAKMKNKKCPVCEAGRGITDPEEQREYRPSKRVAMLLLDKKEREKGVQIWAAPFTLDRDFAKAAKDRETGEIFPIDDPDEGYDLTFDREGKGIGTKYNGVQTARRPSSIPREILEKVLDTPLPSLLRWRTYDEVQALLTGGTNDEEEEPPRRGRQEEPEEPRRRPAPPPRDEDDAPRSRRAEPPSEDDYEPPSREEPEPEEEEPPVRSRRAAPPPEDVDDDPEPPRSRRAVPPDDDDPEPPRARQVSRDEPSTERREISGKASALRERFAKR